MADIPSIRQADEDRPFWRQATSQQRAEAFRTLGRCTSAALRPIFQMNPCVARISTTDDPLSDLIGLPPPTR